MPIATKSVQQLITIYITAPTAEEAGKIVHMLLDKKLIACANIFPINSMYTYDGVFHDEKEVVILGKTIESKFETICEQVIKIHPYNVPCIEYIKVHAAPAFADWVIKEVSASNS